MANEKLSYKGAGVDIDAGEELVKNIKPLAAKTKRDGLVGGIGGFGALFEIPKHFKQPVLVTGTDGVGTKLRLALDIERHNTIGIDLVAMSVNDILVQGAEPLFFLDYFSCGKLDVERATEVVSGIAKGCELSGCALIGGETAEMPGMYAGEEYDLAGFAVGAVEKTKIITGEHISTGDALLGLGSSGAHSNGYSLIRKILTKSNAKLDQKLADRTLGELLIEPTRIYVGSILNALKTEQIKGLAHITGGGIIENIPRILPEHLAAEVDLKSWPRSELFQWIQENGNVDDEEMLRVFNCGIGMVVVCAAEQSQALGQILESTGETVFHIGTIVKRKGTEHQTRLINT
ncbi:MAG: phosphoribosylformylglycinamidine cyclo-ligase [Proteobacteria bacterium]|nr:phosphoribosylformylglycinamidine cyclo-ligase [Pseudomonadota bacterium]MDA0862917.1 phosphoribosylformylglycinamidine cyclo-ligase [Pseudomonadota bacterium]MDA1030807.1 phosphoribosylformylglycinamidine cyclo-ligase [Pseudomonadota bacterium]